MANVKITELAASGVLTVDDLIAVVDSPGTSPATKRATLQQLLDLITAANVSNTPSGNLSAVTVQAALNELQTDVDTRLLSADVLDEDDFASDSATNPPSQQSVKAYGNAAYAAKADLPVLYLPGVAGNYVSTPDHASLDITGDLDLRVKVALDDWTPTVDQYLSVKYAASNFSWQFWVAATGALKFAWSTDGSAATTKTSTASVPASDGETIWVRVTMDVDNGAAGNTVTFYTSTDGATWTQLGSTVVTAGTTSIFSGSGQHSVGFSGGSGYSTGKFYRAQVYNGIAGTLVADLRCDLGNVGPRYRDSTGKVWTFNGSAYTWTER